MDSPSHHEHSASPPHSSNGPVPGTCSECGLRIDSWSEACDALGYRYHNTCFVCCYCRRMLRGKVFYKDQDKIFCEEDYLYSGFNGSAEHCEACGKRIVDTILQANGCSYHPGCFRCCICYSCLDGKPFTVNDQKRVFCLTDYHLVNSPLCAACGVAILPDDSGDVVRVVALDKEFHPKCFRCEDCKKPLDDEQLNRCFPITEPHHPDHHPNQHLLCLNCHIKRIGAVPATLTGRLNSSASSSSSPTPTSVSNIGGRSTRTTNVVVASPTSKAK